MFVSKGAFLQTVRKNQWFLILFYLSKWSYLWEKHVRKNSQRHPDNKTEEARQAMHLRPYTTYLNVVGHCAMCMLPAAALRLTSLRSNLPSSPSTRLRWSGVVRNYSMSSARVSSARVDIASPSQMEQAGSFFGADTEDGDTVLLHG